MYDKSVLDHIRAINDPNPFFRGLICELGYKIKCIYFNQPRRSQGVSKNNFYSLFDIAMLGIISHSMVPIRVASILGFILSFLSLILAITLTIIKILYWDLMPRGYAPMAIGLLLILGTLLFFIGILGEYVHATYVHVRRRPIVVERERINF